MCTSVVDNFAHSAAQTEAVRRIVVQTLAGWGLADASMRSLHVTDVLRRGETIGRRFEIDGFRAMWLWDRDVVIFWDARSQLLKTVSVSDTLRGAARVA